MAQIICDFSQNEQGVINLGNLCIKTYETYETLETYEAYESYVFKKLSKRKPS